MQIAQDLSIRRVRKAGKSGMVQLPDLRGRQERGGWGRAGDSQRAPSAPASDVGASPFGRRPQAPLSCDLRLNHAVPGMVQNACHSGDSSGPLDGSGVLHRLLPAAERRKFIALRREPQGRCRRERTTNPLDPNPKRGRQLNASRTWGRLWSGTAGNTMRSVAGVALIAPARGRASKKIINIMHTGAARCFWKPKWPWVKTTTAKNEARTEQGCFVSFCSALSKTWRPTGTPRRSIRCPTAGQPTPTSDSGNLTCWIGIAPLAGA